MEKINPEKPYNELPLLPPDKELETKEILKKAIEASRSLAELKNAAKIISNYNILLNNLALLEAFDSSKIENIVTTHDKLFKAFSSSQNNMDPAVKEVLNCRDSLWKGIELLDKNSFISTNMIVEIQGILIKNKAGIRQQSGTVIKNTYTNEIIYTPPVGEKIIREKLANLENYINIDEDDIDPLIKLAIMHYQFESIHPFYDGNGRTGRMLNVLYLILKGLLDHPILYLSSYIIKNKADYYRLLRDVTFNNNWVEWIIYMLNCISETSINTIRLIETIKKERDETAKIIQTKLPNIYSSELVDILFSQPYCKAKYLVDNNIGVRKTSSNYLQEIEKIGILTSEKMEP